MRWYGIIVELFGQGLRLARLQRLNTTLPGPRKVSRRTLSKSEPASVTVSSLASLLPAIKCTQYPFT